jgi:tight adherence protein B
VSRCSGSLAAGLVLTASLLAAAAVLVWPSRRDVGRRRLAGLRRAGPRSGAVPSPTSSGPPGAPPLPVPIVMELVAAALDAGLPAPAALDAAVRAAGAGTQEQLGPVVRLWRLGAPLDQVWSHRDAGWEPLGHALVLADRTGASAATLLRSAAGELRASRRRRARSAAHALGVRLVLPLGLTTLPAFVLWTVVPVVLGLADQVLDG